MRITLFAHGTRGDVLPVVSLAWQLAAADHDVTVAVPGESVPLAEGAGLRTVELPFEITAWLSTPEGQRILHTGGLTLMRRSTGEFERHARAFEDATIAAAQGAEALVANFFAYDRALAMAEHLQLPMAAVYQAPYVRSREFSSIILSRGRVPRPLRLPQHDLAATVFWQTAAKTTNSFRRRLGLPTGSVLSERRLSRSTERRLRDRKTLALHPFSPSLFPRPSDWPENLIVTGAWQMPDEMREGIGESVPPDLQAWLDNGPPPVFLGFGSMPVIEPGPLFGAILEVTAELDLRAIISENCVPPGPAGLLPDRLRAVGAVDHDRLFPQCAAVVHHGGIGSVTSSLRAGRPTMVCSVLVDQPWWGEHMRRLGVGTHIPFRKLERDALRTGLQILLDPAVEARARAMGATIRAEGDGLPEATRILEDWLVTAEPVTSPLPSPIPRARRAEVIA